MATKTDVQVNNQKRDKLEKRLRISHLISGNHVILGAKK